MPRVLAACTGLLAHCSARAQRALLSLTDALLRPAVSARPALACVRVCVCVCVFDGVTRHASAGHCTAQWTGYNPRPPRRGAS